jgi:hypothetical protein
LRNGFPRYIWHRSADGTYWFGFLMNEGGECDGPVQGLADLEG